MTSKCKFEGLFCIGGGKGGGGGKENTLNEPEIQLVQARSFSQSNYTESGIAHSDKTCILQSFGRLNFRALHGR